MSYKHLFAQNYSQTIEKFIRVNYAGELAAVEIYKAQSKVLPNEELLPQMLECEVKHFEFFKKASKELAVRQTLMLPIWRQLSSILGKYTAKNSPSTAMLYTQAVETVIEKHYLEQINQLTEILQHFNENDKFIVKNKEQIEVLLENIKVFMQEEEHHKIIGQENSQMQNVKFKLMKLTTKLAIVISERF